MMGFSRQVEQLGRPRPVAAGGGQCPADRLPLDRVEVERRFIHPVMGKTVRRTKKYHAHDEKSEFKVGDVVRIRECRPLSKLKCWEAFERISGK